MARRLSSEWCISGFSPALFNVYGYPTFHGLNSSSYYDSLPSLLVDFSLLIRVLGIITARRGAVLFLLSIDVY